MAFRLQAEGGGLSYLRISKFWDYQNADVWKKCKGHPPWFKHFVHRDREMDRLPIATRLLWIELLGVATRHSNVLEDDLKWISTETRMPLNEVRKALPVLLKGGWLSQTATPRRSRNLPVKANSSDSQDDLNESRDDTRDAPEANREQRAASGKPAPLSQTKVGSGSRAPSRKIPPKALPLDGEEDKKENPFPKAVTELDQQRYDAEHERPLGLIINDSLKEAS